MPIRIQTAITGKEFPSQTSFYPLDSNQLERFTRCFRIPTSVPVGGIVIAGNAPIYNTLRDKHLLPLLAAKGIDKFATGPINQAGFELPPIFEPGTLSVGMADGYLHDHFQSVLRFHDTPDFTIHYQTLVNAVDTACSLLSHTAVMACLPKKILKKVGNQGPIVVIHRSDNKESDIGYHNSSCYSLVWDDKQRIIKASQIRAEFIGNRENWRAQADAARSTIARSKGVFIVVG